MQAFSRAHAREAEKKGDLLEVPIGFDTRLTWAAKYRYKEIVRYYVEQKGVDVNARNMGHAPLHYVAVWGDPGIVELLVKKGADVNVWDGDGWPPLHYAAKKNGVEVAELLLKNGANANAKNKSGQTPLDVYGEFDEALPKLLRKYSAKK